MNNCEWMYIENGYYRTGCGTDFKTSDNGELEDDHVYCQYCGKEIKTEQIDCNSDIDPLSLMEMEGK